MQEPANGTQFARFGAFEVNFAAGELRKHGIRLKVQEQPLQVLELLLARPEELVTRETIQQKLWPSGTFVDFENGLNTAINRLREALGDSAENPRFIVTEPRRGYRFIAPVDGRSRLESDSRSLFGRLLPNGAHSSDRIYIGLLIVLLVIVAVSYPIYASHHAVQRKPFERYSVTQSTQFGDVLAATISPDGKYMAYARKSNANGESLWIRQLSTNSDTLVRQILPGALSSVAFSGEGYLFLSIQPKDDASRYDLYRVPMFGGQPQLVLRGIDSQVSFVAEGKKVCFLRHDRETQRIKILMADVATGKERVLWEKPWTYISAVACNADGAKVAIAFEQHVDILDSSSGQIKTLVHLLEMSSTLASSIAWEPKGDGFIISAMSLPGFHGQLFHVSYPEGTVRRITNDLSNYSAVISISADGKMLSSTKSDSVSSFYLWSKARAAARRLDTIKNLNAFGWLGNDRLLFSTSQLDLGMANLVTGETKIINPDQRQSYWLPSACGDKSVVFSSSAYNEPFVVSIWKMDLETGTLARLTKGPLDTYPKCTGDGKWIIYNDDSRCRVMKISSDGLNSQEVPGPVGSWEISVDGKQYLYSADPAEGGIQQLVVHFISMDTLQELKTITLKTEGYLGGLRFTPDGDGVVYTAEDHGVNNVWVQPFDGRPRRQLTHFTDEGEFLTGASWSPDGQSLGLVRRWGTEDAVLFVDSNK
jgi:Tol biopolymer transport system component/DNA-binding winged helix-turn-helix (wHTH) protein